MMPRVQEILDSPFVVNRRIRMAKKTNCPISRADFRSHAKPVNVVVNNVPLIADVKEFSTGSLGWYLNGKTSIEINGTPVSVQIGMNLTIVGSKELPKDGASPASNEEVA
jgi:hypothetical protein